MKTYITIMTIVYITLEIAAFIKLKLWNIKSNVRNLTLMGRVIEMLILYTLMLIPILNVLLIYYFIKFLSLTRQDMVYKNFTNSKRELFIKERYK